MPGEVHQHYDAAGNLTGTTVVHRETEWDEETRARVLELAEYRRSLCPCGCGLPVDDAWNDQQVFKVDKFTCYATRARVRVEREWESKHEKAPEGWSDGVTHYVVPVEDDRAEETRQRKGGADGD